MRRPSRRRTVCLVLGIAVVLIGTPLAVLSRLAAWRPQLPVSSQLEEPSEAPVGEAKLRLATWNVWGLPFISPERAERIQAIAKFVSGENVDVACFQEVFLEEDRRILCEELAKAGLPYHRYFSSLPFGSGLLTVSRYPISKAVFRRYSKQGNPLAVQHGDWWAGKGAGLVEIDVPEFGKVRIVNTHLHAPYGSEVYKAVRESQVAELMDFLHSAQKGGLPVFLLGDLNYREEHPFWRQTLKEQHLGRISKAWSPIDYIMGFVNAHYTLQPSDGKKLHGTLEGKSPGVALSDHMGIVTDVRILMDESP